MIAHSNAAAEWRAGWRFVLAAGVGIASGLSLFAYIASLFIRQYTADFGWTRGEIALSAFSTLAAGLLAPWVGRFADRVGVRWAIIVGSLGFALACVGMAHQTGDIRVYYALYFAIVFFGLGTTSVTWTRVVSERFATSRGLALSVAMSLVTFTAMAMPPLLQGVINAHGWRTAWLVLGAFCLVPSLIAVLALPAQRMRATAESGVHGFRDAVRLPSFWLAVVGMYLINVPSGGIMNQMAPLIADKGISEQDAAVVLSMFALSVFLGRLIAGFCLDRFPTAVVAFISMAAPAIGCVLLTDSVSVALLGLVMVGIAFAGLSQGAEGDVGPYIVARNFGMRAFSGLMGAITAATAAGTATGSILFGQSHDRTGAYDLALWIGAACFLGGAFCYLFIRPPRTAEA